MKGQDCIARFVPLSGSRAVSLSAVEAGLEQIFGSLAGIHRFLGRRKIRFLILPSRYALADGPLRQAARSIIRRAEAMASEKGLPFVSLLGALAAAGGERLFMDFCRHTPEGNAAIAKALRPVLESWRTP